MPTYKLTYFNARGAAETARYIFAQAGVKYEDVRVEGEEWPKLKPSTPFGVLPVLEVDGKQLGGSMIIGRYLAEQHGLAGENPIENAQIANIVDAVSDIVQELAKMWYEKDEAKKEEMKKNLAGKDGIPKRLQFFEKRASANADGWLAGKLTWADFAFSVSLDFVKKILGDDVLNDFPGIKKMNESVEALPNIAKWIKERPVTNF